MKVPEAQWTKKKSNFSKLKRRLKESKTIQWDLIAGKVLILN